MSKSCISNCTKHATNFLSPIRILQVLNTVSTTILLKWVATYNGSSNFSGTKFKDVKNLDDTKEYVEPESNSIEAFTELIEIIPTTTSLLALASWCIRANAYALPFYLWSANLKDLKSLFLLG